MSDELDIFSNWKQAIFQAFLEDARSRGAVGVSRLTLHEVAERDGKVLDCQRVFRPEGMPETTMVARMESPLPETRTVMRSVT